MKKYKLATAILSMGLVTALYCGESSAATFKDVSEKHSYYTVISEMADKGIISGYEDGTFKPNEQINRQHAALLINNAVTLPTTTSTKHFKDIPTTHPYFKAIQSLQTANLIQPDTKGNFNPTQPLTRGEMAKIIATAYNLEVKANYTFKDVKGSEYEDYVNALYSNGVTAGYEDGTFKPNAPLTRAHYTLFMYKANHLDENFVAKPIGEEEVKETTPSLPESKKLEDYPSDRVITSNIILSVLGTEEFYKQLIIPNSKAQTLEEKAADIVSITKKQNEKMLELKKKIKVTATSSTLLTDEVISGQTLDERLKVISKNINRTLPETIQLINYAYSTGEVYEGATFALRFDYASNMVNFSYR